MAPNGKNPDQVALDGVLKHTLVEAMGLEPTNLLTASQALYQLSYAPKLRGATLAVVAPLFAPPGPGSGLHQQGQDRRTARLPWWHGPGV